MVHILIFTGNPWPRKDDHCPPSALLYHREPSTEGLRRAGCTGLPWPDQTKAC